MKRIENLYEVTQRLCGMIEPEGSSHVDEVRLQNLKDTIDLTERLIRDIILVARYKGRTEHSMNKAGETADAFITRMREQFD